MPRDGHLDFRGRLNMARRPIASKAEPAKDELHDRRLGCSCRFCFMMVIWQNVSFDVRPGRRLAPALWREAYAKGREFVG
jgi:hypothetical protein